MKSRHQRLEAVYRSRLEKELQGHVLVLEAAGIDYDIHEKGGEFTLLVAAPDAERSRAEFNASARENRDCSTASATFPQRAGGWGGVLGYAAVLVLVALFERRNMFSMDWFTAGKTDAGLIRQGQWWRAVTALSLHVDPPHLVGNIVIGGLVGLFAGQLLGTGLAWASILIAGAAGNLLNAWIRKPGHTSVGASTAVFATLGLMATYVWQRRRNRQASRLVRWAPLVGAVVLLSYLGTGGVRTDVGAHVAGFLIGALIGALYGKLGDRVVLASGCQRFLGVGALAALAIAWTLALTARIPP